MENIMIEIDNLGVERGITKWTELSRQFLEKGRWRRKFWLPCPVALRSHNSRSHTGHGIIRFTPSKGRKFLVFLIYQNDFSIFTSLRGWEISQEKEKQVERGSRESWGKKVSRLSRPQNRPFCFEDDKRKKTFSCFWLSRSVQIRDEQSTKRVSLVVSMINRARHRNVSTLCVRW